MPTYDVEQAWIKLEITTPFTVEGDDYLEAEQAAIQKIRTEGVLTSQYDLPLVERPE